MMTARERAPFVTVAETPATGTSVHVRVPPTSFRSSRAVGQELDAADSGHGHALGQKVQRAVVVGPRQRIVVPQAVGKRRRVAPRNRVVTRVGRPGSPSISTRRNWPAAGQLNQPRTGRLAVTALMRAT